MRLQGGVQNFVQSGRIGSQRRRVVERVCDGQNADNNIKEGMVMEATTKSCMYNGNELGRKFPMFNGKGEHSTQFAQGPCTQYH